MPDAASDAPLDATPAAALASAGPSVQLFTDGACKGNPGPGGWGYILKHAASGSVRESSGGEPDTTNNRMELLAVITGLADLSRPSQVEVVTDSEYVAKGSTSWMAGWKRNNWQRREKGRLKPVKNDDLWKRLDELLEVHDVSFTVVRGHSGHAENERCDELAVAAARDVARR